MKMEFEFVEISNDPEAIKVCLNEYGSAGWELVQIDPTPFQSSYAKRTIWFQREATK
jgi:hypothetical protein